MKRLVVALLTGVIPLASGCGPAGSGSLGPAPTASPGAATPSASPPTSMPVTTTGAPATGTPKENPSDTITIETWFTHGEKIFLTYRTRPTTSATSRLALTELIAGPSGVESAAGVGNALPLETTFSISVTGSVATVNFPAWFYETLPARARLRQAQVVYTLTQFATVTKVGFQKDGRPAGAPVGRADYADLLPKIVVTKPLIGQRVSSPISLAGFAQTRESTVNIRLLDSAGKQLTSTFTTSHCLPTCAFPFAGPGYGRFAVSVPYRVSREQAGTLQVYEIDGSDGSQRNVVNIPVLLTR